jgi:hypothetical protein
MPRLGICQWRPHPGRTESEKSHTTIPFTKSSFSLIEKTIAIPKTYLKALTGNIARVHKSSGRDLNGNHVSGLFTAPTQLRKLAALTDNRPYLEAGHLPANL